MGKGLVNDDRRFLRKWGWGLDRKGERRTRLVRADILQCHGCGTRRRHGNKESNGGNWVLLLEVTVDESWQLNLAVVNKGLEVRDIPQRRELVEAPSFDFDVRARRSAQVARLHAAPGLGSCGCLSCHSPELNRRHRVGDHIATRRHAGSIDRHQLADPIPVAIRNDQVIQHSLTRLHHWTEAARGHAERAGEGLRGADVLGAQEGHAQRVVVDAGRRLDVGLGASGEGHRGPFGHAARDAERADGAILLLRPRTAPSLVTVAVEGGLARTLTVTVFSLLPPSLPVTVARSVRGPSGKSRGLRKTLKASSPGACAPS